MSNALNSTLDNTLDSTLGYTSGNTLQRCITYAARLATRSTLCAAIIAVAVAAIAVLCPGIAFATPEHPIVVSLGDSYSSGEGVEPFYGQEDAWDYFKKWSDGDSYEKYYDWLAHRSELSWSGKLRITAADGEEIVMSENKGVNWYFVASSGAETIHVQKSQTDDENYGKQTKTLKWYYARGMSSGAATRKDFYLPNQLEVFDSLEPGSVDYVTLTLGGNDMGFVDILTKAVIGNALNPNGIYKACKAKWKEWPDVRKSLAQAYRNIQEAAGDQAKIIVAGYPRLIDDSGINSGITGETHLGINAYEAMEINSNVTLLNAKIHSLVNELREDEGLNIYFVSVEERFKGHEAYSEDPYLNKIILGPRKQDLDQAGFTSAYSVHPNEKGTQAYARAVQKKIDELEDEKAGRSFELPTSSGATDGKTRDIALVLDVSPSMNGDPLDEVKRATVRFGDAVLESTAQVGVVEFSGSADVVEPLTGNAERVSIAADELGGGGGTNIGDGLTEAEHMLNGSKADRKIIILMTDGEPNVGMSENELVEYATKLKSKGYYIYTLGFFSSMSPGSKSAPQQLLGKIASEGCHYEVTDASDLQFFFGDIADQINGVRYNYIRIACPVDVTVSYDGETLSSGDTSGRARTAFGTLTFEDAVSDSASGSASSASDSEDGEDVADAIKILRLREGPDYEISINGTGSGSMDYVIGFVDDDGEYSDMRYFDAISIGSKTQISTLAKVSDTTRMTVDFDGDGEVDTTYEAHASSHAEVVDNSWVVRIVAMGISLIGVLMAALIIGSLAVGGKR